MLFTSHKRINSAAWSPLGPLSRNTFNRTVTRQPGARCDLHWMVSLWTWNHVKLLKKKMAVLIRAWKEDRVWMVILEKSGKLDFDAWIRLKARDRNSVIRHFGCFTMVCRYWDTKRLYYHILDLLTFDHWLVKWYSSVTAGREIGRCRRKTDDIDRCSDVIFRYDTFCFTAFISN